MTNEDAKAQLLWMLCNNPGYYMWHGWQASLPEEQAELPLREAD